MARPGTNVGARGDLAPVELGIGQEFLLRYLHGELPPRVMVRPSGSYSYIFAARQFGYTTLLQL